jgi:hypothetical protein
MKIGLREKERTSLKWYFSFSEVGNCKKVCLLSVSVCVYMKKEKEFIFVNNFFRWWAK